VLQFAFGLLLDGKDELIAAAVNEARSERCASKGRARWLTKELIQLGFASSSSGHCSRPRPRRAASAYVAALASLQDKGAAFPSAS